RLVRAKRELERDGELIHRRESEPAFVVQEPLDGVDRDAGLPRGRIRSQPPLADRLAQGPADRRRLPLSPHPLASLSNAILNRQFKMNTVSNAHANPRLRHLADNRQSAKIGAMIVRSPGRHRERGDAYRDDFSGANVWYKRLRHCAWRATPTHPQARSDPV